MGSGRQPAAPFDREVLLRQRRRIRGEGLEIDLPLDADQSRPDPLRVGVVRRGNPPLWPHPQDGNEQDRHEEKTRHGRYESQARAISERALTRTSRSVDWMNTCGVIRTPCTPIAGLSIAFVQILYLSRSVLARSSGAAPPVSNLAQE